MALEDDLCDINTAFEGQFRVMEEMDCVARLEQLAIVVLIADILFTRTLVFSQ